MPTEQEVLDAVEGHVYDRFGHIMRSDIERDFDDEELERIEIDEHGYVVFSIENLSIEETRQEEDITLYYVSATLFFQVDDNSEAIEGTTDTYEAYQDINGEWCIQWHSS